jgi:hypothetical protein
LLTHEWLSNSGLHELYPTLVRAPKQAALKTLTAYAVHRPDGLWSLLLINKDPEQSYDVKIGFGNSEMVYSTPLELFQYSSAQYMLNNDASNPVAIKNDPPSSTVLNRGNDDSIELPPYSLTVVRGRIEFGSPPTGVSNTHPVRGAIFIDR